MLDIGGLWHLRMRRAGEGVVSRMRLRRWTCLAAVAPAAAFAGPLALAVPAADAHDWYPYSCCSGQDCRPISASEVAPTPGGWLVRATGEVIPYGSTKLHMTPREAKGEYHRCSAGGRPEGRTICLYVPDMGS